MSGGSLPWPSLSLEFLRDESRVALSFCLPLSGLKVPRLVNCGRSSKAPSWSLRGLLSRLSEREGTLTGMAWAAPEPAGADLAWNRKRRLVEEAAEEEEEG